jgi:hypothetical protein
MAAVFNRMGFARPNAVVPGMSWNFIDASKIPANVAAQAWYDLHKPWNGNPQNRTMAGSDGNSYLLRWQNDGHSYNIFTYVWGPAPTQ